MENENSPNNTVIIADEAGLQGQPSPETVEQAALPVTPEVARFYEGHRTAMLAWAERTGNTNFPVVEKDGKLFWVNRAARRAKR